MATDAFENLRLPDHAEEPRPAFRATLRARLERELGRSSQSTTTQGAPMPPKTLSGARTVTAYLTAKGAAEAIAFYTDIFGAVEVGERYVDQSDGRVGHAEFTIGDTTLMISDEYPEMGVLSPATLGGSPIMLNTYVDDVDASYARAVAAGARGMREPADQFYGSRSAQIIDPWGHRWSLDTVIEGRDAPALVGFVAVAMADPPAAAAPMSERARAFLHGPTQLGYFTLKVADVERATRRSSLLVRRPLPSA